LFSVGLGIETRRSEILRAIERQLTISAEVFGDSSQLIELCVERLGQSIALGQEDLGHVMYSRRLDATVSEQSFECQLNNLLRLSHNIGPTLTGEEYV
jgi:hypothetical protein